MRSSPPERGLCRLKSIIEPQGPIPVSRSTWWAGVKSDLPPPVKLRSHITTWRGADIQRLIDSGIGAANDSRIMGLPGKPDGIDGSQVEAYFNAGRIQEIADYCKSYVINTYRLWLRHELFRGRLDQSQYEYSEYDVQRFAQSA
jgi:predicted DNA-binding transcriptional regulator AlpA